MQLRWISLIGCLLLLGLVYPINQTLAAPTTYTVTKTADTNDGVCNADCSLREAITTANLNAGKDTIQFNIPGAGVRTIQPLTALPTITDPVIIDGTTQPGFPGTPIIELDGSLATAGANGLKITAGNSTVRGLVINRFLPVDGGYSTGNGILIETGGGNRIEGNYLGTDATGNSDLGNDNIGVFIALSGYNWIGGGTTATRNLISGNGIGVLISGTTATRNIVIGNYIGTNAAGTASVGNELGVKIDSDASDNQVGGTTAGERNIISGNFQYGVGIGENGDIATHNNSIQGNYIGTDVTSLNPLANGTGIINGVGQTTIGGIAAGAGNLIAFNALDGIVLYPNTTEIHYGNAIWGNIIHSNGRIGIDLMPFGVTPNDLNDPDDGPNGLQNFPVLTSAQTTGNTLMITGTLNSGRSTYFRLQFFANDTCDASGYGEGQTFLGNGVAYLESGENNTIFTASFQTTVAVGKFITATASDYDNSTSEFSACRVVTAASQNPQTFNVTKTADTFDGACNADCSLREAINAANANAGSTVNIPAGTYTITRAGADEDNNATGDLDIRNHMTINGVSAATTIINGSQLDRIFHIVGAYTVNISGLTIQNGKTTSLGGGLYNFGGAMTLSNCTVSGNEVANELNDNSIAGGGIANEPGSAATITGCLITNNTANINGGGIANGGSMTIIDSSVTENAVTTSDGYGGGGIYSAAPGSTLEIIGSTISNNTAETVGGIWSYDDTISITNSLISNNSDGALYTGGGFIKNTTFSGNTTDTRGGAITTFGDPLVVENSTFVNNTATVGGGAIWAWRTDISFISITNSTFSGNNAPIGGAILAGSDDDDDNSIPITIAHSTFNNNAGGGAVYVQDSASVTIRASILGTNTGGNCVFSPTPGGIITSTGYNISEDTSCNTYFTAVGDLNNTNPLLAALADNGGLTQTMALLNGSPALDRVPTANCTLATDQRGVTRPFGSGCDSGAYEFATETPQTGSNLHVNTTSDTDDGVCGSIHCSLREAITAANANPGSTVNIPAGTYTITRAGADEDSNATGDFDINAAMTITGAGAATTIIDGNDLDRIFQITGNFNVNISGVTVRNGSQSGIANSGSLSLNGVTVSGNVGSTCGGIHSQTTPSNIINIVGSVISDNDGSLGGGICSWGTNFLNITNSTISNNSGGGVTANGAAVLNSTFANNTGQGALLSSDDTSISGSTFVNNSTDGMGGAINIENGVNNQIVNSTFVGNTAIFGSAVYVSNSSLSPLQIIHSTFANNTASGGGAIHARDGGEVNIRASLFNANVGENCDLDTGGSITSTGYNISSDASCNSYFTAAGDLNNTNPLLVALANNGGLTQTMALLAGSPALNRVPSANCTLNVDQRGFVRPVGSGCDSGAYESNSTPAPPPSEAPQRNYFTTSTPTLTWSRVTTAVSYIIEVDTDRNFTAPFAFRATGVTTTSITTTSLTDGTYYWRVRMVNASGVPGMWSLIDSFVVDVP